MDSYLTDQNFRRCASAWLIAPSIRSKNRHLCQRVCHARKMSHLQPPSKMMSPPRVARNKLTNPREIKWTFLRAEKGKYRLSTMTLYGRRERGCHSLEPTMQAQIQVLTRMGMSRG